MPVRREDVDFFFNDFIKVSTGSKESSVWAVGSYDGDLIMTVVRKKIDNLIREDIAKERNFVTLSDLMKFDPYRQYDSEAIKEAKVKVRMSASVTT